MDITCAECSSDFGRKGDFEAHVNGEHLDYFPYSCGHCSHYFTTEELAHFHAKRKKHLPMRIREHPNPSKEERMLEIVERSLAGRGDFEIETAGEDDDATSGDPNEEFNDNSHENDEEEALPVSVSEVLSGGETDEGSGSTSSPSLQRPYPIPASEKTGIRETVDDHLAKHGKMFACRHCDYTGHSNMSVKVHITWKHKELSAKTGVLDFSTLTSDELSERCFGKKDGVQPEPIGTVSTRPKSSKFIAEVDLQPYDANSDGGPPIGVVRTGTMPSGRVYRYMFCQECGIEVIDALASQHVFQTHIKRRDMVKCGYCEYSTTYPIAEVKRHCAAKHSDYPLKFYDHRQDPDVQELYLKIRAKCFPSIQGSRAQSRFQSNQASSNAAAGASWADSKSELNPLSMVMAPARNFPASSESPGPSSTSRPSSVQTSDSRPPELAILEILKKAAKDDGSPASGLDDLLNEVVAAGATTPTGKSGKYLTAAHIKNSQKDECRRCGESVTHLWESRHVWKHLEEEGKARYQCAAANCTYKTYLLRNLDMHCNYHGQGLSSEKVGLRDMTQTLTPDWMTGWRECFGDRTPPPPEGSTAARHRGKRRASPSPVAPDSPQPTEELPPVAARKPRRDLSQIVSEIAAIKRSRVPEDVACRLCFLQVTQGTEMDHVAENHMEGLEAGWECGICQFQAFTEADWVGHWTTTHVDSGALEEESLVPREESQERLREVVMECFGSSES